MCAVSMITDHYRDKWPTHTDPYVSPNFPSPIFQITREQWLEYQELKKKMEEYDKRSKQPHCEKPEVADWEKAIESVLRKRGIIK